MKIFIMTDLEGPDGVNGRSNGIGNQMLNQPVACQSLVNEINACVRGLVKAGADEIVVWDGHGGSNSIDLLKLDAPAKLAIIGGDLAPACQANASYDASVFIGFHAMQGTQNGFMNHSFNSHAVCDMFINGSPIGEIGMIAYETAYFGVPTIMITGDTAACKEAKDMMPAIETVSTKDALARYTVINRNPQEVYDEIEAKAEKALKNLKKHKPLKLPKKFEFELHLMCDNNCVIYEKIGWERVNHNTVKCSSSDFIDLWSRYIGWAPGVHNKKFNISPAWKGEVPEGRI